MVWVLPQKNKRQLAVLIITLDFFGEVEKGAQTKQLSNSSPAGLLSVTPTPPPLKPFTE